MCYPKLRPVILILLLALCLPLLILATGCAGLGSSGASQLARDVNNATKVTNEMSADVMAAAIAARMQTLPSAVYEVPKDSGWGGVVNIENMLERNADGSPVIDPVTGRLHSLRVNYAIASNIQPDKIDMEGLESLHLKFALAPSIPEGSAVRSAAFACPIELMDFSVSRAQTANMGNEPPSLLTAASGGERSAIIEALSKYATAHGASVAQQVTALADGTVKVLTATGREVLGRLVGTYAVDAGISGAGTLIGAVLDTGGQTENFIVTDENRDAITKGN